MLWILFKKPLPVCGDRMRPSNKISTAYQHIMHFQKIPVDPSNIICSVQIYKQAYRSTINCFYMKHIITIDNGHFGLDNLRKIK